MQKLAKKITSYFILNKIIEERKRNLCEYVLQTKLTSAIIFFMIFSVAAILGSFIEMITFIFVVITLRKRLGGYHANSELKCISITFISVISSVYIILPMLERVSDNHLLALSLLSNTVCLFLNPVSHINFILTDEEKKANKAKANRITIILFIISISLYLINKYNSIFIMIFVAEIFVIVSVVFAKIIKQEEK